MTRLEEPGTLLEQGSADTYGQWLRDQLDPTIHLERYQRDIAMRLHHGADDHHVPQANARVHGRSVRGHPHSNRGTPRP